MTGTRLAEQVRARLLARRRALGLTQAQAASVVGWAQASLSKYEKGQLGADIDTLAALARRYGLTFADLLDGTEPADPERARLLAAWAKLSADARALTRSERKRLIFRGKRWCALHDSRPPGS